MEVQSVWNDFETELIRVVDNLVPLTEFENNIVMKVRKLSTNGTRD